jgi:Xaa-Pro aminopeptidase
MNLQTECKTRRERLLNFLQEKSQELNSHLKLVLESGSEKVYSNDVHYPFRANSDFYYLSGFKEPDSALVLDPNSENPYSIYLREKNPEKEIWDGPRLGLDSAPQALFVDKVYLSQDFQDKDYENHKDIISFLHKMRSIKSDYEILCMKKSNQIAKQAHREIEKHINAGVFEYEIEAILLNIFRSQGASGWAYPPIVASGPNSCILHYISNSRQIVDGDLVLVDAGCEYEYYASDISRTFSANDTMSSEQKEIYDLVLKAQELAIKTVKPGGSFMETHEVCQNYIGKGLKELAYIDDAENINQIKKYFMHGTGHSLGIDVHDVGIDKKTSRYEIGMVTTIEPGIYIPEKGFGIRIEDNVLVSSDSYEIL